MENAVDALKMAFAAMVFVMALSISMSVMSTAKDTSEHVFYMTDKTNFYDYIEADKTVSDGRIVSGETIIPTLYRYYKENFNVVIQRKQEGGKSLDPITFNLEEEIKKYKKDYRKAPWVGKANIDTKKRIDIELSGESQKINGVTYKPFIQGNGGLMKYLKDHKFKETFLEQRYSGKILIANDDESLALDQGNIKMWIIYEEV